MASTPLQWLYIAHSALELLAGGFVFVKGNVSGVDSGSLKSRLYRRFHASGLLGFSFIGVHALVTGEINGTITRSLLLFHALCSLSQLLAFLESGTSSSGNGGSHTDKKTDEKSVAEKVSLTQVIFSPHTVLALAFGFHVGGFF